MDKWEIVWNKIRNAADTGTCRGLSEPGGCKCRAPSLTKEEGELVAFSTLYKGWQG